MGWREKVGNNNISEHPRMHRSLLGFGIIFLFVACLGGGLAFLGYLHVGKFSAGLGIILGNLCIVAFWILKLLRRKETSRRGRS
jgi:hypothetical protein